MATLIVVAFLLSLTTNLLPLLNAATILSLFPLRLLWSRRTPISRGVEPTNAMRFLAAAYLFWSLSYLLTSAPVSNFFSYHFLRFDGALLVGYLPLFLLGDVGMGRATVRRSIWLYLGTLAAVALLGLAEFAADFVGTGYKAHPAGLNLDVLYHTEYSSTFTTDIFHGLYRAHNATGSVYAMAALVALAYVLRAKPFRVFSWSSMVFASTLIGLILSQSRSGYVAFTAAFAIVFLRTRKNLRKLFRLGVFVLVPLAAFLLSYSAISRRFEWIANFQDPHVLGRFALFQAAAHDFFNSPLVGIGFGRYNDLWKSYSGIRHIVFIATGGQVVNSDLGAHNGYLQFLAEGGLVGLFLMLGVWVATYRWAWGLRQRFGDASETGILATAVQGCIVAVFFFSLTEQAMFMASTPLTVFALVGLLRNLAAYEARAKIATHKFSSLSASAGLVHGFRPAEGS